MKTYLSDQLRNRNQGICELCNNEESAHGYSVLPEKAPYSENDVALCHTCLQAIDTKENATHWRCLEGSIWSTEPAVQALSYRLLFENKSLEWANEILHSVELEEGILQWALSAFQVEEVHKDAFGNILENGDTVVLTQALNVKGTSFTAAKGTIVKKIRLVKDNPEQIEGKINEQLIVILTKFVKKGS